MNKRRMKKEKRKKPIFTFFLLVVLPLGGLLSCGLEAFYYIDYIPQGVYNDTNAVINLPSGAAEGYTYFDSFIIFYRIYISGNSVQTGRYLIDDSNARNAINSTLNSDFIGLYPLVDITSTEVNTSSLENTFANRRYFLMAIENADINDVLGSGSLGRRVEIAFPPNPGVKPTLTVNGSSYALWRALENQDLRLYDLNPQPDRNLLNDRALYNTANIGNGRNEDVATTYSVSTTQYTYVSMYIAARGTSLEMPPRSIYSQPTFIGIFQLANSGG